jgi:hypothetical protein
MNGVLPAADCDHNSRRPCKVSGSKCRRFRVTSGSPLAVADAEVRLGSRHHPLPVRCLAYAPDGTTLRLHASLGMARPSTTRTLP